MTLDQVKAHVVCVCVYFLQFFIFPRSVRKLRI